MSLVQVLSEVNGLKVALVEEPNLRLLKNHDCVTDLVEKAIQAKKPLKEIVRELLSSILISYDDVYNGISDWNLLPCFDHRYDDGRCLVSGTGLTHRKGAENRNAMHSGDASQLTDSIRMYLRGEVGGKPAPGTIGAAPEWFYKGNGGIVLEVVVLHVL